MSLSNTVSIGQVEPDVSPMDVKVVLNPLEVDFVCLFAGKEFTLPALSFKILPAPVACHVARHLAKKMRHETITVHLKKIAPGSDPDGVERWRRNEKVMVLRADVSKIIDQILFASMEEAEAKLSAGDMDEPEVKVDEVKTDVIEVEGKGDVTPTAEGMNASIAKRAQKVLDNAKKPLTKKQQEALAKKAAAEKAKAPDEDEDEEEGEEKSRADV